MTADLRMLPDGSVTTPAGFRADGVYTGIKTARPEVLDVGLLLSDRTTTAAGRFTRNQVRAAPVNLTHKHLAAGDVRAVVANSGCANACTGPEGDANALAMSQLAAKKLQLRPEQIAVASTGLIGSQLPMEKIATGVAGLQPKEDGGLRFARAIMTTDTVPKSVAAQFEHGGGRYSIGGCAKGAGMIHPDMATMLSFITTDAPVPFGALDAALGRAVDRTFNMLTVDGDNSTNDTVLLLANGAAGGTLDEAGIAAFGVALEQLCAELVRRLASDAEGAEHLLRIVVRGAADEADARRAARTVAGSMLLKSAVHGGDPNWGRAVAAIGRSGAQVEPSKLQLRVGPVLLFEQGTPCAFDRRAAEAAMRDDEVIFEFDLGLGSGEATAWGCDLTEEYVRFNSEYST